MFVIILSVVFISANPVYAAPRVMMAVPSPFPVRTQNALSNQHPGALIDGRVYLPLRQIAELLGINVTFNGSIVALTGEPLISSNLSNLTSLPEGTHQAIPSPHALYVGGQLIDPNPAILINDSNYLPFRFLGELLNIDIGFDDQMVTIGSYHGYSATLSSPSTKSKTQFPPADARYLERGMAWGDSDTYIVASIDDLLLLTDIMADNSAPRARFVLPGAQVSKDCITYLNMYSVERMESVWLQINSNIGILEATYPGASEVSLSYEQPDVLDWDNTAELNVAVSRAIQAVIVPGMRDIDKVRALHDYLVAHVEYDLDTAGKDVYTQSSTAYGALVLQKALCGGYSEAMKLLLNTVGVECEVIAGSADGSEHAWNLVKLDGEYYHVDVTFDDPVVIDSWGQRKNNTEPIYSYYCLSDRWMRLDHYWNTSFYPAALGEQHRIIAFYETEEAMFDSLMRILQNGGKSFTGRLLFDVSTQAARDVLSQQIMNSAYYEANLQGVFFMWDEHGMLQVRFMEEN